MIQRPDRWIVHLSGFFYVKSLLLKINVIFVRYNRNDMNNKIVKGVTALVFIGFSVVLVLMMVQEIKNGLVTAGQKGFFALYVVLLCYALWRVFVLIRDIIRK